MLSGSLVLFFAAAFGALKEADGEQNAQAEDSILSFGSARDDYVPEQKEDKTPLETGEALVLHQEHVHPGFAKKASGFPVTNSGAAYFLMKYFEAIWRSQNNTTQARRLAEGKNIFSYIDAEVTQALGDKEEIKNILENAADAALKNHLRHHHDHNDKNEDPQITALKQAVVKALRILKTLLKLMEQLEQSPILVKLVEENLDDLARSIARSKKLLLEMLVQKEVFARTYIETAQKELEEMKIATLKHKSHFAEKFITSPKKMRDSAIAQLETLVEEALFQATQADQLEPVQANYTKAKELAKAAKIFILQLEAYVLMLRAGNEAHRKALDRAALELDFARAGIAGISEVLEVLEIISNEIDV